MIFNEEKPLKQKKHVRYKLVAFMQEVFTKEYM
ncbi:Uncharacterised protein [Legionella wadsworthii]|uniref:Uncharacterized protein n=1 Tax=Legionella wadsworthii TaxID=28088 RepID=A0A378LMA1_9GAMM|nr:Uncharacterised protein [Legionella wadsworthii]